MVSNTWRVKLVSVVATNDNDHVNHPSLPASSVISLEPSLRAHTLTHSPINSLHALMDRFLYGSIQLTYGDQSFMQLVVINIVGVWSFEIDDIVVIIWWGEIFDEILVKQFKNTIIRIVKVIGTHVQKIQVFNPLNLIYSKQLCAVPAVLSNSEGKHRRKRMTKKKKPPFITLVWKS